MRTETDSREKIISAAYDVLAEKGYDAASTKEIARRAGVAQGLINYYFPSKDDLFIEVLKVEGQRFCEMSDRLTLQNGGLELLHQVLNGIKAAIEQHPQWYRLKFELYAMGLRNPRLYNEVQNQMKIARERNSQDLGRIFSKPPEELEAISAIVFSAIEGLALQKLVDSQFDLDQAFEELLAMVLLKVKG
jgi:AcrR family transcriptional regulator